MPSALFLGIKISLGKGYVFWRMGEDCNSHLKMGPFRLTAQTSDPCRDKRIFSSLSTTNKTIPPKKGGFVLWRMGEDSNLR